MKSQRGYYDFNMGGFFLSLVIVGAVLGIGVSYLVPWLWALVKPLLHALTA